MRQGKWSEEQIISILKQVEEGRPVAEVCREHGVGEGTWATLETWRLDYNQLRPRNRLNNLPPNL